MSPRPDIALLLEETRWLTVLARRLAGEAAAGDDLVQDALAAALTRPPSAGRPVRGWLATVLRRRSCDLDRARVARTARERMGARPERQPSTLDLVAKAELQRALVGAVLALDEPYRTCVLLRFFENLTPRAIARRTGAPVATVHSRLQRALEQLRARLGGDRRDWLAALAPLLLARLPAPLTLGVPLVNAFGKLALGAAVVVVSSALWIWLRPADPAAPSAPLDSEVGVAPLRPGVAPAPSAATAPRRTRLEAAPTAAPAEAAAEVPPPPLRGRVIDVVGQGLAGVRLCCTGTTDTALGESGPGGRFELRPPAGASAVLADDPFWSTVLAGAARIAPEHECTVIVASRLRLAGRVVDAAGAPLAGAEVAVHLPLHLGAELGILLDYSLSHPRVTTSDARGAFALPDVPLVEHGTLTAALGGYEPAVEPLAPHPEPLELVLQRPSEPAGLVRGVVLDPSGASVSGARVSAGAEIALTDARGEFALDLEKSAHLPRLIAVASSFQPAVYEPERDPAGALLWPARVVLRLGGAPMAIGGHVVDEDGRPVVGARVWVADPLYLGHDGTDAMLAETLLGREERSFWAFVSTDGEGRFEIAGLLDRRYGLRALEPSTLVLAAREGVRAGDRDVELVLTERTHARVRGRVVARDGSPLSGVSITVQRPALEVQLPGGGTRDEWAKRERVTTGAGGEFELRDVPQEGVEVFASGDTIMFASRPLAPGDDVADFVLTADRRVHLQVEVAPPTDRADALRVLDANGKAMLLRIMRGETSMTNRTAAIADGRSQVISLGEGAATVVLYRADREVGRIAVRLTAGQINTVAF